MVLYRWRSYCDEVKWEKCKLVSMLVKKAENKKREERKGGCSLSIIKCVSTYFFKFVKEQYLF